MHLHLHVPVPQPSPGAPIDVPDEVPPEPGTLPEITDPPPVVPTLPIREPGINVPSQAMPRRQPVDQGACWRWYSALFMTR